MTDPEKKPPLDDPKVFDTIRFFNGRSSQTQFSVAVFLAEDTNNAYAVHTFSVNPHKMWLFRNDADPPLYRYPGGTTLDRVEVNAPTVRTVNVPADALSPDSQIVAAISAAQDAVITVSATDNAQFLNSDCKSFGQNWI